MTRIPSEFQIKSSDATTRVPVPVFETSSHESLCRFSSSPPIPYIYQVEPIDPKTKSWKRKENQSDRIGSEYFILFYLRLFVTVLPGTISYQQGRIEYSRRRSLSYFPLCSRSPCDLRFCSAVVLRIMILGFNDFSL